METTTRSSEPFITVFLLYPGTTQLDFTGPLEVLSRLPGAKTMLASLGGRDLDLGHGLVLTNLSDSAAIPRCSLLCVPGGFGVVEQLVNEPFIDEIRRLADTASYVTSVCTGSLLLGAAGLLQGKRAASHWAWREHLTAFGALVDVQRVVRDGNLFTGGGVTAGIDLALCVTAELEGREFAEALTLALEYAPAPPFDSGRPELASSNVLSKVQARFAQLAPARATAVARAQARLAGTDGRPGAKA